MKNHNIFICSDILDYKTAEIAARKYALDGFCPLVPQYATRYLDINKKNEAEIISRQAMKHLTGSSFIAVNLSNITGDMKEYIRHAKKLKMKFVYFEL